MIEAWYRTDAGSRIKAAGGSVNVTCTRLVTADHRRLPQTNVHVHRRPKKIAGKRKIDDLHSITDVVHVGPSQYFKIFYGVI